MLVTVILQYRSHTLVLFNTAPNPGLAISIPGATCDTSTITYSMYDECRTHGETGRNTSSLAASMGGSLLCSMRDNPRINLVWCAFSKHGGDGIVWRIA